MQSACAGLWFPFRLNGAMESSTNGCRRGAGSLRQLRVQSVRHRLTNGLRIEGES
jgi:hypothetical protein